MERKSMSNFFLRKTVLLGILTAAWPASANAQACLGFPTADGQFALAGADRAAHHGRAGLRLLAVVPQQQEMVVVLGCRRSDLGTSGSEQSAAHDSRDRNRGHHRRQRPFSGRHPCLVHPR